MIPLVVAVLSLVPACTAGVVLVRRRARSRRHSAPEFGPIRPAVRLLTTDDDLRDAVERAVEFERRSVDRTSARIDRYARIFDGEVGRTRMRGGHAEILDFETSSGSLPGERRERHAVIVHDPTPDTAA